MYIMILQFESVNTLYVGINFNKIFLQEFFSFIIFILLVLLQISLDDWFEVNTFFSIYMAGFEIDLIIIYW